MTSVEKLAELGPSDDDMALRQFNAGNHKRWFCLNADLIKKVIALSEARFFLDGHIRGNMKTRAEADYKSVLFRGGFRTAPLDFLLF